MFVPHPPRRPTPPQPNPLPGMNRFQPNIRPDFMTSRPAPGPRPQAAAPMSNFERARRQIANPYENHERLTEKQHIELNWEKRTNPLEIQRDLQNRARIYGADAVQPLTPAVQKRPINYYRRGF